MAIGAHPDDVELCCAGTLARYAQRGDHVTVAIACNGDSATFDLPPEKLVAIRSREALRAAKSIGADLIQIGLSDWQIDVNIETKKLFADAIRQARPDVILTHYHTEYGSDHNNTFILVRDGALAATVPSIQTTHPAVSSQPAIFMWEPLGGYGFVPEAYVDISKTLRAKLRMLECHHSQCDWLRRHGGLDFGEYVQVVARYRGFQAGVQYAEGFVALKNWAQIAAKQLLP
jgi:LmbE family N-acetylglucosaminyl deacetylase